MDGTRGVAISTSVFAAVTIVLIIIAATGFGLYATKSAATMTETMTQTSTETSTLTSTLTVAGTASSSGVSEALALTVTNSGGTSTAPSVSVASNFPGSAVIAASSLPSALITPGSEGVYDYTITGAGTAEQLVISITNDGSTATNPDITATSTTSGAIVTPAGSNPTSIAAGSTGVFTFTITGAEAGHVNLSCSILAADPIAIVIEAVP